MRLGVLRVLLLALLLVLSNLAFADDAAVPAASAPATAGTDAAAKRAWAETNAYKLGAGDVIDISVYGQPDLEHDKLRLAGTGLVSFPFGTVMAVGMTIDQLEQAIAAGLRQGYLVNPQVSVNIEQYRPFFIYGEVEKPGAYAFEPGLNVRKAVAMAGGFTERADPDKISVVRESDASAASSHIGLNDSVNPGDTVKVEESFF
jgi:polysaccharide export outer membrane protein